MAVNDTDHYEVKVLRPIKFGHSTLRPEQDHVFKGDYINALLADDEYKDAIEVGNKVDLPA